MNTYIRDLGHTLEVVHTLGLPDMPAFKPIPVGANALVLVKWGCGDECCCHALEIRAELPDDHPQMPAGLRGKGWYSHKLWEGAWWNSDSSAYQQDLPAIKAEAEAAWLYYTGDSIVLPDDYWDWEFRKTL